MSSCIGCGAKLQSIDPNDVGYVRDINSVYCERCFRINNYGDYKVVVKDNEDFIDILKGINNTGDLVLLVVDLFCFNDLSIIKKYLNNDILFVLTKRDVLPSGVNDSKLIDYFSKYNFLDTVVISSLKNYNYDLLFELINKYKRSRNVYVVGFTNAGKSTMINKLIYNYSDLDCSITTSILPSTTLDKISININDDLTIIDTPGILQDGSIYDKLSGKELKRILPNKTIKPKSFQIKGKQYISVSNYLKLDLDCVNIVMFISNSLVVKRFYKDFDTNLVKHSIKVCNCDVVISGLGFIKVIGSGVIDVYTLPGVLVYTRDYLI